MSQLYTDFYTNEGFIEAFKKLNAVSKEYENKDSETPIINIKILDLNRKTLPLYKRLDDKNKENIHPI